MHLDVTIRDRLIVTIIALTVGLGGAFPCAGASQTDAVANIIGMHPRDRNIDLLVPSAGRRHGAEEHARVAKKVVTPEEGQARGIDFLLTKPILVGVQSSFERIANGEVLERTREQLQRTFGASNVVFERLTKSELQSAVTENRLDFVIADAGFYTQYETVEGLKALASIWPISAVDPVEAVGALYITRSHDEDIRQVEDMAGRRIAAYYPSSFSGYLVAERDLLQRGLVYESAMRQISFYGDDPKAIIEAVLNKRVDVGILPTCTLENLVAEDHFDRSGLRLLGVKDSGLSQCAYSTELYPSYYFASSDDADSQLTKAVSASLFTMGTMSNGMDWGLSASNRAVHDLFFDLKLGPYAHLARWSFERFVKEQASTVSLIVGISLLIISYAVSLSILVRRRTKLLRQALADRNRIEKLANASRDHIANLERTGIVGQMSTMIAHELKQPLGAITNFGNGLLRRSKRGPIDPKLLNEVLEEIVEQGSRASEIVNRVRAYAKHQTPELKMADMSVSVERAIETFKRSRRTEATIHKLVPPYLWADIDGWEIELAVLNLLKNAADALEGTAEPQISVRVRTEDRFWRVEVIDNGPRITQADVDAFMMPLVTSKANGLGLGLSIVANIAERHHGRLVGLANADHGVTIAIDIPRSEAKDSVKSTST